MIKKIGSAYVVVHGHAKKKGSKTDKPKGTVIKKYPFKPGSERSEAEAKRKAQKMHTAIILSQRRRGK